MYMNRDNGSINFVLLFDPEFKVKVGRAYTDTKYGVCFENFTRYIFLSVCNLDYSINMLLYDVFTMHKLPICSCVGV